MNYALLGVIFVFIILIVYVNYNPFVNQPKLSADKDLLFFNNIKERVNDKKEHMIAYVDETNYTIDESWKDYCGGESNKCQKYSIMDKTEFETIVNNMTKYIDTNKDKLGTINDLWEFKSRRKYVNIEHTHNNVGDLIYHLKDLDSAIFSKIYNNINEIPSLFEKVEYIYNKQEYIKERDEKTIKLVYNILNKLNQVYQENKSRLDLLNVSINAFPRKEICKTIKKTSKYNPSNLNALGNGVVGCPNKHYLKGISYDVDKTNKLLTQSFHCCESNVESYEDVSETVTGTNCILNSYRLGFKNNSSNEFIILKNGKLLGISMDYSVNKYKFSITTNKYDSSKTLDDKHVFVFKNSKIMSKGVNHYLSKQTDGKLRFNNNEEFSSDFEIINNKYIKVRFEPVYLTYDFGLIKSETISNSPENKNEFEIIFIGETELENINKRCLEFTPGDDYARTPEEIELSVNNKINSLENNKLHCPSDHFVNDIAFTEDESSSIIQNIKMKCLPLTKKSTMPSNHKDFIDIEVDFSHSHDFLQGDPIHSDINVIDSQETDDIEIELYSEQETSFMNSYSKYSPLQKIFVMLAKAKLSNINNIDVDYESLFNYFKTQINKDTISETLLSPKT